MNAVQIEKLRCTIARNERIAHWGGWIVVGGLIVEVIFIFLLVESGTWCGRFLHAVPNILVAIGVWMEVHFGRLAGRDREKLQLEAEERAAESNRLAQEARERTAKIEAITAWRRVSPELKDKIIGVIQAAAHSPVVRIEFQKGDPEAHMYANDIGQAVSNNGEIKLSLVPNEYPPPPPPLQQFYGVFVASDGNFDASAVVNAFSSCGVQAERREKDLSYPTLRVNGLAPNLYIYVGIKPWRSSLEDEADYPDE